jgi:predicted nucleic acid-binding protein
VIQLDTSFLIRAMLPESPEATSMRQWLRNREAVAISAPAWAEFQCGPISEPIVAIAAQLLGDSLPFTGAEAALAGRLFNETGRRRGSLIDCMIAATAIELGDELATSNHVDFKRFEKLGLTLAWKTRPA